MLGTVDFSESRLLVISRKISPPTIYFWKNGKKTNERTGFESDMQGRMQPPSFPYFAGKQAQASSVRSRGALVMMSPREVIEIAFTYIGVIALCSLIHYGLVELRNTILEDSSSDEGELLAGLIQSLDYAFIISATIAVLIKLFSNTWGAMKYSQVINTSEGQKNTS